MKLQTVLCAFLALCCGCAHSAPESAFGAEEVVSPVILTAPESASRAACREVFGADVDAANSASERLIVGLAGGTRSCESNGQTTTCCGGNIEGQKSDGICCTFGGWSVSCEIVTCMSNGHCYDHEG